MAYSLTGKREEGKGGGQGELTQTPPMSKMQAFTTIMMYSSSFV